MYTSIVLDFENNQELLRKDFTVYVSMLCICIYLSAVNLAQISKLRYYILFALTKIYIK